jgi:3-mercaptopyruvate sulfurtransferase SseA
LAPLLFEGLSFTMLIVNRNTHTGKHYKYNQIRRLMDLDWEVVVKHSYREANKCADMLANIGCTLDSHIMYYESCPSECYLVWSADVLGIATPQLIPV